MENDKERQAPAWRSPRVKEVVAGIKTTNERLRTERNARRNKAERDPLEYVAQKDRQRQEYSEERCGEVRSYEKIVAPTKADRAEQAKARHAEREAKRYAGMTPAERKAKSDAIADEAWQERRRKKGIPEDVIEAALIVHREVRAVKRDAKAQAAADDTAMQALPTYNIMG